MKIQAGDSIRQSNFGSSNLGSMTIHGDSDWKHCPLYHIKQQCGKNYYGVGWKEVFFWAILYKPDNNLTLRVFTKGKLAKIGNTDLADTFAVLEKYDDAMLYT